MRPQGLAGVFTQAQRFRVCALLAAAGLLALAGCGSSGPSRDVTHQEGALYRSGDTYGFSGAGASKASDREAMAYLLNGVVFYLLDYPHRTARAGGFGVAASWNDDPDPEVGPTSNPPDGYLTIEGDTARLAIQIGGGAAAGGMDLTGSFDVAALARTADEAYFALAPSSFPGMSAEATFLRGLAATPLTVHWTATGDYGDAAVEISGQQDLTCEFYDYTLIEYY